jgi:hypothetical protein
MRATGWSYTKVNRLLTEGRRAFLRRVSGIQRGADCARYEPLLSALADGEASSEELALLRPHMRTCLSCRAALREFRTMPERVASVVPPAAVAAAGGGGPLRTLFESVVGAAQHTTAAMGERVHAAAELATGQKVAAVAASAAALAGGGTAVDKFANHRGPLRAAQVEEPPRQPVAEAPADPPPPVLPPPTPPDGAPEPTSEPVPPPEPEAAAPPPDPANEFDPAPAAEAAPRPAASPSRPAGSGFAPGGSSSGAGGNSGGEFAP